MPILIVPEQATSTDTPATFDVTLLTGGQDPHYAFGLAMALRSKGVGLDIIGSNDVACPEFCNTTGIRFLNLQGGQRRGSGLGVRVLRLALYYARLLRYSWNAKPKVFHILWNNRFELFDRTLLLLYYRALGKKIVLTAHNVNAARRDSSDTLLNRLTLRIQYALTDHIFVHTQKMKRELVDDFGVSEESVTTISYGINNAVPDTSLTACEAKRRLGIGEDERVILFFGRIGPYKGLDTLFAAFHLLPHHDHKYRLIVAGKLRGDSEEYFEHLRNGISQEVDDGQILLNIEFVPDSEIEMYFKAADVLALPYKEIFQSGVLFLAYSFGLPVVATDVGSFKEEMIEGATGFLCRPGDGADLAEALERYFASDLYFHLEDRRQEIQNHGHAHHSWDAIAELTRKVYTTLSAGTQL